MAHRPLTGVMLDDLDRLYKDAARLRWAESPQDYLEDQRFWEDDIRLEILSRLLRQWTAWNELGRPEPD